MNRSATIILMILFLPVITSFGQGELKHCIKLKIIQRSFPGPNPDVEYHIKGKRVKVLKVKYWSNNWKEKDILYFGFLKKCTADSICSIIKSKRIDSLDDNYSSRWIDGMMWTFDFHSEALKKEIILSNYYLEELGVILDLINQDLPEKRRYISFDLFDIKKEFENSETIANTR